MSFKEKDDPLKDATYSSFLSWIDKRLREIKGKDIPFGGCNVLIFGDDNQLATMCDTALYYNHCALILFLRYQKIILFHNLEFQMPNYSYQALIEHLLNQQASYLYL